MNWIKKFFQPDEEEIANEHNSNEELTNVRYNNKIEAKMTYKYPKGKFRFPVIPDEEVRSSTKTASPTPVQEEKNIKHQTSKMSRKVTIQKEIKKTPFRPTEVASPIYGYAPREEQEVVEIEIPATKAEEVQSSENLITSNLEIKTEPINMLSDAPIASNEKGEHVNQDSESSITDMSSSDNNNVQEEQVDNEVQDNEVQGNQVHDIETTNHHSNDETSNRFQPKKRSRIPFNVIMLKQDKKKLKSENNTTDNNKLGDNKTDNNNTDKKNGSYLFPQISLLHNPPEQQTKNSEWLNQQRELLDHTLANFKVGASVVNVTQGPSVTRFEVHPQPGVKVNKITNLADDIKLSLSAKDIRIEAPIPGKNTIGIEVPNIKSKPVYLRQIIKSKQFTEQSSALTVALGLDISGTPIVTDLNKMPHGLIAGATGSGKSVCINAMLISLLYNAAPHEVKLLLIDPKMVELAPYNHIPHLVSPVITDVKAATAALKWAVEEMERRYELFAHSGVRDITRYNELVKNKREASGELPYLVIIIDELADLMMVSPGDVEEAICRIAQKARACGIHLIVATQRPSVDVITGLIKANIPTRIAFSVSSQVDSRTIIDTNGAEKLLGKGDMLFLENGSSKTLRVQGNFVSDDEIEQIVGHVKNQMKPSYIFQEEELLKTSVVNDNSDDLFLPACEYVVEHGGASTSALQRSFRIGYNRAARLIDMMEEQGIISEAKGTKPRDVLIAREELSLLQETSTS
ncbi:DNA translocase FtsK [Cytobacillus sp. IB215665]|uniref:DNA translocase FtsK n=1 Tax=Cytobacillus sp. IB215665 TaxID=3097357 RepID=UPI002A15B3CA|nr:DNA translocase FtsK [Cytobacillus sp. IB215665]MDX8367486.1 DNA translocase FtsK [Cytobacillus sp. IB215665]